MMLDENVVAVSPSSVYRVLKAAKLLKIQTSSSKKGTGFQQPLKAHEHWHTDITYLNICGTFYFYVASSMAILARLFIGRSENK